MADALNFNAREVEPAKPRDSEAIPAGWYRAWIIGSEKKPTKRGDGSYLELVWEVVDGPHAKRKVWDRLNIDNPSKVAQDIGREALSAICHAINVLELTHSGQLHGEVCAIKVAIEKNPGYSDKNKITGYLPDGDPRAKVAGAKVGASAPGAVKGSQLADDDPDLPF
jgi:hypothetical protein